MLLSDFFESVYLPRRLFGRSPETARLYRYSIQSFGHTLGHPAELADLTDEKLRRHMQRLLADGRARSTANKDRAQLLALWRFAHRTRLVRSEPDVPELVEPIRNPEAWTAGQIHRLLDSARRLPGTLGQAPAALWWQSLILACLDTGERIGAILAASWDCIEGDWLLIPAELRKGKRRDRLYRLEPRTVDLIDELPRSESLIWPWPHSKTYLWTVYGQILRSAGLPSGRRNSFHRLRRTTASVGHAAGLDAQSLLDHADRRTTERYLDPRFTRQNQACDVMAEFLERREVKRKAR